MFIQDNLKKLISELPNDVTLVAVSKTKPITDIQKAYNAKQLDFGENKVQEMTQKYEALPKDIRWHMIGHLQKNKVKYLAQYVYLIHSVDSLELLIEINKQAQKHNRIIHCLLQIYIAQEETKFGLSFNEAIEILNADILSKLRHIKIKGLMGMASFTENSTQINQEFRSLKFFYDKLKSEKPETDNFKLEILSMGMSSDYQIAIANGSNMIRIGSTIFGNRNYVV